MASVAFFCPQSKAPQESYLNQLHSFLTRNKHLEPFLQNVVNLKDIWETIAEEREDIAALEQGPRYVQNLSEWITTGDSSLVANRMSGIVSLPLLVIIQIGQYFQYLEVLGIKHAEFIAQLQKGGGLQGYCGGLAPAIAIACSKDEGEVVENATIAMRLALVIGAFGELGDDAATPGATTIVVRTKRPGQADELISQFPGAYISGVTDPKSISIVGPVAVLAKVQSQARNQGLLVQEMYIRGKVHNPENADLAEEVYDLCDKIPSLQLPTARKLQAQVRSNKTGKPLTEGSLTHELVNVILVSRCEWYTLLVEVAKDLDLSRRRTHSIVLFGIGDCVPLMPFHKLKLQVTKLDALSFISNHLSAEKSIKDTKYSFPQDATAIVGVSCRLPGANNIEELWDIVSKGVSRHEEVPNDRFDLCGSFRASQDLKFVQKRKFYGNFIDNVGAFDHTFFRTNPKEAMNMDPQQRILLELAYQAMESSGYLRTHRRESGDHIGCFIGASFTEYLDNTGSNPATAYTATGTIRAFLSGKISYYFGWSGPSEVIDTACSSSLVAINRACKAIQSGECTMALAGGINIITGINNYLDLGKAGFLSFTGQCKPFDESADGYCRADGGGLVVLKRLSQAIADQDQIFGVIPGVGTNQGGLSASLTIPHSPAQKKLYQNVLDQAAMKSDQISYVEAHGTGTQAGDPLEIASIQEVFAGPDRSKMLNIGSLKGNIGHSETGAGVASLLKVIAMINKGCIPPQASHKSLNPKIPALEPNKMCIASKADHWDAPLLAAFVNSYGAAGSNAALICCEGPVNSIRGGNSSVGFNDDSTYPIIISAATKESLYKYAEYLGQYLKKVVPRPRLGDLAYTLSERRKHDKHRFAIRASDTTDVIESLKMMRNDKDASSEAPATPKRVVLAFSGQSKPNVGLDKGLYNTYPRLRSYIDNCNNILTSLSFPSILPAIFQPEPVRDIVVLQCSTFAMQFAFAMCWLDAGLEVSAVVGHSFGELTALVVSGVLSLTDGLKLVASRASLMATEWGPERGTMLAISSSREVVQGIINEVTSRGGSEIEFACHNSPSSQIIVSSASSISQVEEFLKKDPRFAEIRCQRLDVTHGFHSKFTTPIIDKLEEVSRQLTFRKPEIPLESCTLETLDQVQPDRPSKHLREPVYFLDAVRRIEGRLGPSVWIEAGMNSPVIAMVKQATASPNDHVFLGMKTDGSQAPSNLLSNVTINLWQQGIPISHWSFVPRKEHTYKQVWLPPYQFQPTIHWLPNVDRVNEAQKKIPESAKSEERLSEAPSKLVTAKTSINQDRQSAEFQVHQESSRFTNIVSGHAVRQRPLCPASLYMESAAMAVQTLLGGFGTDTMFFRDLIFQTALGIDLEREVTLTLEKTESSKTWSFVFKSISRTDPKPKSVVHAKGRIGLAPEPKLQVFERLISDSIVELENKSNVEKLMSKRAYGLFSQVVSYAELLQGISRIFLDSRQAVAEINIPQANLRTGESTVTKICDTVTTDVFIQVLGLLINSSDLVSKEEVYIATAVESTTTSAKCDFDACKSWKVYAKFKPITADKAAGDVFVCSPDGTLVMTITGVQFTKLLISKLEHFLDSASPKARQGTVRKVERIFQVQTPSTELSTEPSTESSTEPSSVRESDTIPSLSSATSLETDSEIATPGLSKDDGEESLKGILAEYTGIPATDITDDANIGDLGVDSLAAVELAEELQSGFGQEIPAADLLGITYGELAKICQVSASTKVMPKQSRNINLPVVVAEISTPASVVDSNPTGRQDLYNILSETSGAPVASIKEGATLQELGVDSLSAVELKDDIEKKFSVAIEDDQFTLDSTVKEILDFLGLDRSYGSSLKPDATAPISQSLANGSSPSTESNHSSKTPIRVEPTESQKEVSAAPPDRIIAPRGGAREYTVETVVYKEVDGIEIPADIYLPRTPRGKAMPIALMIHGGGHMTLSRKAIRPAQTSYLLENGVLPISIDYRLCPEVNLIDGAMADVRDACGWVQSSSMTSLQAILDRKGVKIQIDRKKFVMVGWSTGGHLAMTTAWTTKAAGLVPPCAILNFYSPTEFESGDLDLRRAEEYPERTVSMDDIIKSLPTRPITSYDIDKVDTTGLGWVRPGDPRSELVLSLFKEGTGLPLMLNGLSGFSSKSSNNPTGQAVVDPERVAAISPMLQLLHGNYDTPTFLIHGERDEIVPFHTAVRFAETLSEHGVRSGLLAVRGARHIHDLKLVPGTELWRTGVAPGYDFLFDVLHSDST